MLCLRVYACVFASFCWCKHTWDKPNPIMKQKAEDKKKNAEKGKKNLGGLDGLIGHFLQSLVCFYVILLSANDFILFDQLFTTLCEREGLMAT